MAKCMQDMVRVRPAAESTSSYSKDFGKYGDDPLQRGAGSARELTRSATTADLAAGSARSTLQRPGDQSKHVYPAWCSLSAYAWLGAS